MRLPGTGVAILAAAALVLLTGCATPAGDPVPSGSPVGGDPPALAAASPAPPSGEVIATGTVLDAGEPELCLGGVAESYPPQCSGIPLDGWDWSGVDGSEQAAGTRWGSYAVQGRYDGERFTVTGPVTLLALYDPMAPEQLALEPGDTDVQTLDSIQDELPGLLGEQVLSSSVREGRVWTQVVWDDGTLQQAADAEFGENVVVMLSALQLAGS
ncbi:hypothetical protein M4I32_01415 [Microbacterium sp. LRZ72]|uniref:hypothetical protein n=1 Tax=Microbacterium sp. LRZ72 TaxID=2942481 RepID=UPI0029BE9E5E|nr:hypothetical protein [Microbacterium sp. LRZ72]MDX2375457.1 hypothetical protein [Microbacterium sp. LRZ72]